MGIYNIWAKSPYCKYNTTAEKNIKLQSGYSTAENLI